MSRDASHTPAPDRQPWLFGSWVRRLRLSAGLVLLTYVTTHLLDHATLNISIAAADRVLQVQRFVWQGLVGTAVLYAALTIHPLLGLWALYARRHFRWSAPEAWQLLLGLTIPAPLMARAIEARPGLPILDRPMRGPVAQPLAAKAHDRPQNFVVTEPQHPGTAEPHSG